MAHGEKRVTLVSGEAAYKNAACKIQEWCDGRTNREGITMFGWGKPRFDDAAKMQCAEQIARVLEWELIFMRAMKAEEGHPPDIEDKNGSPKRRALGYVYGVIDAALRWRGHDIADMEIGPPITFQVLRKLWPGREQKLFEFIIRRIEERDGLFAAGMNRGGQGYLDKVNGKHPGSAMGLGILITEGDNVV
jgi:hypothetical protein